MYSILTGLLVCFSVVITTPTFASVTPKTGCTFYVDGATGNNGNSGTAAAPFRTPQGAEVWLENIVANHGSPYTITGADGNPYTYTKYVITTAQTVCITNSTTYDSDTIPSDLASNPNTGYPTNSKEAYTLEIKVSGSASAQITFTAYDPANPPTIRQTGYAAIQVDSTANYVTLSDLIVTGRAYSAISNLDTNGQPYALTRYSRAAPANPSDWTYYDGNCITIKGNPVDYTLMQYSSTDNVNAPYPVAVPTNIVITNNRIFGCGGGGIASLHGDYITLSNNAIYDNSWWSLYGTSGISDLGVDSETYPTPPNVRTTPASTTVKQTIQGNYIFNNREYVPWRAGGPAITDGEGLIIDTNANYTNTDGTTTLSDGKTKVTITAYAGQTSVSDNALWLNGSAGLQSFRSAGVTFSNNSLYHNRYYPPILAGKDSGYAPLDTDGYPSLLATPASKLSTRSEIEISEPTGTTYVVLNNIYGPTPIRTHACNSAYVSGQTYTCVPLSGNKLPNQTINPYTYVNYNVLYEAGVTLSDPNNYFSGLTVSGENDQSLNIDPLYFFSTAPPEQVFGQPYSAGSSTIFPGSIAGYLALDLRIKPATGQTTSPAYYKMNYSSGLNYLSAKDITGATQPGTYALSGAWASPE